jgi:hypothetical protein
LETGFQIRDNSVRRCPEIEFGAPGVTEKIERKGEKECRPTDHPKEGYEVDRRERIPS